MWNTFACDMQKCALEIIRVRQEFILERKRDVFRFNICKYAYFSAINVLSAKLTSVLSVTMFTSDF